MTHMIRRQHARAQTDRCAYACGPLAAWAGVLFGVLVADSVISDLVRAVGGPVAQGLVTYAGVAAFFWWTMHFLLAGRVSWRLLLRPAILTALFLFWIGLELFSSFYFSASIISDSRLYGTIGVVFSLMIWFIAIAAVIVLGAVAGATWNQHKGHSRVPNGRIDTSGETVT